MPQRVYIGTYTRNGGKGIHCAEIDTERGRIKGVRLVAETPNPSFLALHPSRKYLYAVNELRISDACESGHVSAWRIDTATGDLHFLGSIPSHGFSPAHIAIDRLGAHVLVANYNGANVCAFALNSDGSLGALTSKLERTGSSVHPERQRVPHPHSTSFSPTENCVAIADLGTDELLVHAYDATTGKITPIAGQHLRVPAGAGPRHGVFTADGNYFYLSCELSSEIIALKKEPSARAWKAFQIIATLPKKVRDKCAHKQHNAPSELQIGPSGRHLYVANRGDDSISIFEISAKAGALSYVDNIQSGGQNPRHFAFLKNTGYMLVTNQDSGSIALFRVCRNTGSLQFAEAENISRAACVCSGA